MLKKINTWYLIPEPFFINLAKQKMLPFQEAIISLQREWDSNPRYVAINTLSRRAPSATRPPLYFI